MNRLRLWSPPATPAGCRGGFRRTCRGDTPRPPGRRPPPWRRQSRRRPLSRGLIFMVAVLLLAAACSAPVDSGPKTIRSASLPAALRAETSSTTTTTVLAGVSEEVTIYFIGPDGRLQPVKRRVSSPVTSEKVLQKLFAGPLPTEEANGTRTAISGDTSILGTDIEAKILTVDTSKNFAFGLPADQISAYAQVVFTAVDLEGIIGVQFAQNGRRISVQAGDGSSQSVPLSKGSYIQLAPR